MSSALRALRQAAASTSRATAAVRTQQLQQRAFSLPAAAVRVSRLGSTAAGRASVGLSIGARQFSVSARVLGEGSTDSALVSKIDAELQYENDAAAEEGPAEPEFLKDFKENGVWTLTDVPTGDEAILSRTFGNEQIRVMFSLGDLEASEYDEPGVDEAKESGEAAKDEDEDADDDYKNGPSFPIRCQITITKTNSPGAISVDTICQDGMFQHENVSFYADATLATELTADADFKRRGVYMGPDFNQLDEGLQDEFDRFLVERGIDGNLAGFIPDYAEYKEQNEYVRWLENVKTFVEK